MAIPVQLGSQEAQRTVEVEGHARCQRRTDETWRAIHNLPPIPEIGIGEPAAHAHGFGGGRHRIGVERRPWIDEGRVAVPDQVETSQGGAGKLVVVLQRGLPVRKVDGHAAIRAEKGVEATRGMLAHVDMGLYEPRVHDRAAGVEDAVRSEATKNLGFAADGHDSVAGHGDRARPIDGSTGVKREDQGVAHDEIAVDWSGLGVGSARGERHLLPARSASMTSWVCRSASARAEVIVSWRLESRVVASPTMCLVSR
jgi:hypothetical protein